MAQFVENLQYKCEDLRSVSQHPIGYSGVSMALRPVVVEAERVDPRRFSERNPVS